MPAYVDTIRTSEKPREIVGYAIHDLEGQPLQDATFTPNELYGLYDCAILAGYLCESINQGFTVEQAKHLLELDEKMATFGCYQADCEAHALGVIDMDAGETTGGYEANYSPTEDESLLLNQREAVQQLIGRLTFYEYPPDGYADEAYPVPPEFRGERVSATLIENGSETECSDLPVFVDMKNRRFVPLPQFAGEDFAFGELSEHNQRFTIVRATQDLLSSRQSEPDPDDGRLDIPF